MSVLWTSAHFLGLALSASASGFLARAVLVHLHNFQVQPARFHVWKAMAAAVLFSLTLSVAFAEMLMVLRHLGFAS